MLAASIAEDAEEAALNRELANAYVNAKQFSPGEVGATLGLRGRSRYGEFSDWAATLQRFAAQGEGAESSDAKARRSQETEGRGGG